MNSLYELLAARALREVPELPRDFDQKLRAVTDELGGMSESALLQFFLTPKPTLGRETPLETLLFGSLPRLIAVARVHAGSGAPTQ